VRPIAQSRFDEGADGCHDLSLCLLLARVHRGLDGDQKPRGDRTASLGGRSGSGGRRVGDFLVSGMPPAWEEKSTWRRCGQPIEAQPNLGPDQPIRGDVEREPQQSEKNHGNAARPEG